MLKCADIDYTINNSTAVNQQLTVLISPVSVGTGKTNGRESALTFINVHLIGVFEGKK